MTDDQEQSLKNWAEKNFKAMKTQIEKVKGEMRDSKPRENINVRRVESDNLQGQDKDQIVVEHKVERWYSVDYFRKMLGESSENSELDL